MGQRFLALAVLVMLAAILDGIPRALANSGGPDVFGYTWQDNNPVQGACTYSFFDIASTGTIVGTGDDVVFNGIPIGFTFNYYGTDYTTVNVSTNGFLAFGTSGNSFSNTCPQPVTINDLQISAFWDDLYVTGPSSLRYETTGSAPNRTFIVQWENVGFCCTSPPGGTGLTFQVQLREGSNIIAVMYDDVEQSSRATGDAATIGIDGPGVSNFLATSCNTANTLSDGHARFFLPPETQECGIDDVPVQSRAEFAVSKTFTDGDNPTEVEVTINCFTGLPLTQSQTISETQDVEFVVTDFDDGELDCEITEEELSGYTPTYQPAGPGSHDSDGGCNFQDVVFGTHNTCHIVNDADYVDIEIEKLWVIEGSGGDDLDTRYKLTLYCDAPIADGDEYCHEGGGGPNDPVSENENQSCKKFYGDDSEVFIAQVQPQYPSSNCWVSESVYDSGVEIDNDCGDLVISAGTGDSCVITNTVFYEGIPTLNQFGMALLALIMLAAGVVAFRRPV